MNGSLGSAGITRTGLYLEELREAQNMYPVWSGMRQSGVDASRAVLRMNDCRIHTRGAFGPGLGDRHDRKSGDQRHVNQGRWVY